MLAEMFKNVGIWVSQMLWNVNLKCYGMWAQMYKNVIVEC
jgi:hypothetical protein